ncbi:MAG TPA: hypothetical protein VMU50_00015 [Polyangia bacterium]|nr:hypothetical protein [Polyangia bacterium]
MLAVAPAARATLCADIPNAVYVTGSTAAKPLVAELGRVLIGQDPPVTVMYQGQGSCSGVDAVLNGTPVLGVGTPGMLSYWDRGGVERTCQAADQGVVADVGLSDVFASTCFSLPLGLPVNVADYLGPVNTMTFVVPRGSAEKAISAEAAYYIYGFGNDSGVDPWTDETAIFRRDLSSGTQRMIGGAIGVDAQRWKGTATTSSTDMITQLNNAATAARAIGILSTDVAQENRSTLRILAYQHYGQSCAFFPDRDASSNEKINVRDGHYAIWGPLHLLIRLDDNGVPRKAVAGDFVGYLTGAKAPPAGLDMIQLAAQQHVVPPCAMRVKRTRELGPMASVAPPGACGCYYEKMANGATTCAPCSAAADCPASAPVCSFGYCETQ